jgi:uncharacterized membrane protein YbhN (UPF0104 family)
LAAPFLHAACVVLVLTDITGRAWRIAIVLDAMDTPLTRRDALALTMFGDASAALTPWRMGGEPARVFGATRGGAGLSTAIIAMGFDSIVTYLVLIAVGAGLAVAFGQEWAASVRRGARVVGNPLFLVALALLQRVPSHLLARVADAARRALAQRRAASARELAAMIALSTISLTARVAILPVVAASFGVESPVAVITMASFTLLNGQLLMPTPSGAGAVELAAVAGVMGTHEHTAAILATWRLYVTVLPILFGVTVGVLRYGRQAVLSALRRSPVPDPHS